MFEADPPTVTGLPGSAAERPRSPYDGAPSVMGAGKAGMKTFRS
jgi:hypothetical protein